MLSKRAYMPSYALILAIAMGLFCTPIRGDISHNTVKTFTLMPTTLPIDGPLVSNRCRDIVYTLQSNTCFPSSYLRITGFDTLWYFQRGMQVHNHAQHRNAFFSWL